MLIGNKDFDSKNKTYIMGILNITPDSFSDGGSFSSLGPALSHAGEMLHDGADIIDVGGESTRPGHIQISDEEEISRVCPVIEKIKQEFAVPVSIDTYKSKVAEAAISAGADLINDIWGLKYDAALAGVIAGSKLPCCLMHNRAKPSYDDYLPDFLSDIAETLAVADRAGIRRNSIILDPGIGFGKTYENNLVLLKHMDLLRKFELPLLLGTSRKSFIGLALDLPVGERLEGTLATTVMAVLNKYMFVRVHDVKANYRAVKMTEAIMNAD